MGALKASTFGQGLFESLRDLPKTDGSRKHATTAFPAPRVIRIAATFVDGTRADEMVMGWQEEDREIRATGPGGRNANFPVRALIVAVLSLALARQRVTLKIVHAFLTSPDLSQESRRLMGMPTALDHHEDKVLNAKRRKAGYTSVTALATRVSATFDPQIFPSREGLTRDEAEQVADQRDPRESERNQKRADLLQMALLIGTFEALPESVRGSWDGDITLDGTVVPTYGAFGDRSKRRGKTPSLSPETNAGWHVKEKDSRDVANGGSEGVKPVETRLVTRSV